MGGGDAGPEAEAAEQGGQEAKCAAAKCTAAVAYDYEADPRWADYLSNVLVPPHLAARPDVIAHFRRKFYQRFIGTRMPLLPRVTLPSAPSLWNTSAPSSEPPAHLLTWQQWRRLQVHISVINCR